ncbi:DUF6191 domain-containing protein [Streptomyces sp. NPDC003023]|uniref:DUF6191 domain-containing protein n=1 Tax=Streptomyces sp. NPDC003023 TaxID=3364675 RepID=UPI0036BB4E30
MFNAFDEMFAPGRKHTDDERNRLALTRVDVGDGDPGRGPIDLDSGKVTVNPRTARSTEVEVEETDTTEADTTETDTTAADTVKADVTQAGAADQPAGESRVAPVPEPGRAPEHSVPPPGPSPGGDGVRSRRPPGR